jgi:tetratricopeptide (TPR) repeat protein
MARRKKRLNIKVVIIGLMFLMVFALGAFVVYRRLSRDPHKFLKAAEEALAQKDYESAAGNYGRAFGAAKDDDLKIEILFTLSEFYLINDGDLHEPDWMKAVGCWQNVVNIDPKHIEGRMKLLDYFYEAANSGNSRMWQRIDENSSELLEIMEEKQLEADPYVVIAKGRASLEMAHMGEVTDREGVLAEAIEQLEKAKLLSPKDVEIYRYLANTAIVKGQIESAMGIIGAEERAFEKSQEILQQAVAAVGDDPKAHVNLLNAKLTATGRDKEKLAALEPEFKALAEKFGSNADVYAALSRFHQSSNNLDNAIETITKANELEPENINYALITSDLHYRKGSIYNDMGQIDIAIDIAEKGLSLPDAQEIAGPREYANKQNRYMLYALLSKYYIDNAIEAAGDDDKQSSVWADKAGNTVHEIGQILGAEDNVHAIKWRGMLALAQGRETEAIRLMYDAYTQLAATGQADGMLSYWLAKVFENRPEVGLRRQFLAIALNERVGATKPQVILDYVETFLKTRYWTYPLQYIDAYEKVFGATQRSRRYRIRSYIGSGLFDEAVEKLAEMEPDSVDAIELKTILSRSRLGRIAQAQKKKTSPSQKQTDSTEEAVDAAELPRLRDERNKLVARLLELYPERVKLSVLLIVCNNYVANGDITEARSLIDKFLKHSPDNVSAEIYRRKLSEPDPKNISQERIEQITQEAVGEISDEARRYSIMGEYYRAQGKSDQALTEFKKAYASAPEDGRVLELTFNSALQNADYSLSEQLAAKARTLNLDECDGNFFSARLDLVREDYKSALNRVDDCLKVRPVFPGCYLLRSQINSKLSRRDEAISDAKTAVSMNPTDGKALKIVASVLYDRNMRLGRNVTPEQYNETKQALEMTIRLNPKEWSIQSLYANYIQEESPSLALAARQQLQKQFPNVSNNLLLGKMALQMALEKKDGPEKEGLLAISSSAYKKAYEMEPDDTGVLNAYSEFLRLTNQQEKVTFLNKEEGLWQFYLRDGQYEKATEILQELYTTDPKNVLVIRGLVVVAQQTNDTESLKRYSQELLAIDNTVANELLQLRSYLESGLLEEVEPKLASFRERNPQEPRGMLLDAWFAMMKGQLNKALTLIDQNLAIDRENATAWRLRGTINRLLGNTNEAVEDLQKSKSINATATIQMQLAKAYVQTGRVTEAIGELTAALQDERAPVRVRSALEQLYVRTGRKNELKEFYAETLSKYPDSSYWYHRAGRFALTEKNYKDAEEFMKKAWQINQEKGQNNALVLDFYLETLLSSKQYDKLIKLASKYTDTEFATVAYCQIAQAQMKLGSKSKAILYYRKAIDKAETNEDLILSILNNMSKTVGVREIASWSNEKLQANPNSISANLTMSNLYSRAQEYNNALKHIEKCIEIVGTQSKTWVEYSIKKANILIMAYIKTKDQQYFQGSIAVFEDILAKQPDNGSVLNNLAFLLADNNEQLEKAIEYARRAHEISPNDPARMDTYAFVLCKTGEYEKAMELLHMAIQRLELASRTVTWDIYEHLGMAQEGLERKGEAAESYRRALDIGGENIFAEDKKRLTEAIERVLQ